MRSSAVQGKSFRLIQRQRGLRLDRREARMPPLRQWCIQAERDAGERPGRSSADEASIKELRTANEILKKASACFAQAELDRPFRR